MNWIDCPAVGEAGLKVKEDVRTDMPATVSALLPSFEALPSVAVSETV
jgi:hypothetical protein